MENVLVAMHGYSQKVPDGYRPWKEVVKDRLTATLEVAEFFKELGCEVEIMISGVRELLENRYKIKLEPLVKV